jgi:drug/metabolite transporter (DMT)-like permease
MKKIYGLGALFLIGILFGISGVIAKYLSQFLTSYEIVFMRFTFAFIFTFIVFLYTRTKINFKLLDKKYLLLFSVLLPLSVIFFTLSISASKVSTAVFSFYLSNLISSFFVGKIFLKEQIRFEKWVALFLLIGALILLTNPLSVDGGIFTIGLFYGIVSGIFQTLTSYAQKRMGKIENRNQLLLIQTLSGIIIAAIAILAFSGFNINISLSLFTWSVILIFGLIFLLISYLFLVGFEIVDLNVGNILVSSELIFGPVFAFMLLSEPISSVEIYAGVLIILGVVIANTREIVVKKN